MADQSGAPLCGAHARSTGKPCAQKAMYGTDRCRFHGGKTPAARANADKRKALAKAAKAVATFGLPVEIDPHDALLEEVHRTAGHVRWLGAVIGGMDQHELEDDV